MIFNCLTYVLIGVTLVFVFLGVFDIVKSGRMFMAPLIFSFVLLLCWGLVGWGLIGMNSTAISINRQLTATVVKTESSDLILVGGDVVLNIKNIYDYNYIGNRTNIIINQSGFINIYEQTQWNDYYTLVK